MFWKHKTRAKRPRLSRIEQETVQLIRRLVTENRTWGAERIRGEVLKLGIRVSKRTAAGTTGCSPERIIPRKQRNHRFARAGRSPSRLPTSRLTVRMS